MVGGGSTASMGGGGGAVVGGDSPILSDSRGGGCEIWEGVRGGIVCGGAEGETSAWMGGADSSKRNA